jgi:signal transduction histidine kinase
MTKAMASSIHSMQVRPYKTRCCPLVGQTAAHGSSVVALKDKAGRKHESERSQIQDRLAAMGEMAAKIAHEIRNPLGSIELFATSLEASLEEQPDLQLLAERISSGVKSIETIISNLLQFVRSDDAHRFERFDIYEALDDSLFFMQHLADKERGVDVKVAYGDRPLFIKGDVELMKQVCLNIILNAIQSMPHGGVLGVSTARRAARVEIQISDSGMGIAPGNVGKIFDPFFTTKERGTGLGLSIVHSIVEMHGGIIDVESTLGKGTVFSIGLPLFADASDTQESMCETVTGKEASA